MFFKKWMWLSAVRNITVTSDFRHIVFPLAWHLKKRLICFACLNIIFRLKFNAYLNGIRSFFAATCSIFGKLGIGHYFEPELETAGRRCTCRGEQQSALWNPFCLAWQLSSVFFPFDSYLSSVTNMFRWKYLLCANFFQFSDKVTSKLQTSVSDKAGEYSLDKLPRLAVPVLNYQKGNFNIKLVWRMFILESDHWNVESEVTLHKKTENPYKWKSLLFRIWGLHKPLPS